MNDEARACIADTDIIRSEGTQIAIAKFYIALFLFYGDVIKWYQSSSPKKVWHSLNESFADHFTKPLAHLKHLSQLVQRAASSGSAAETRVARLEIEGVRDDLRAGFQGQAREIRELRRANDMLLIQHAEKAAAIERLQDSKAMEALHDRLWSKAGALGTALLLGQKENMEAEENSSNQVAAVQDPVSLTSSPPDHDNDNNGNKPEALDGPTKMFTLSRSVERLLSLIPQGARTLDFQVLPALAFDQRIAIALERWTRAKNPTILYLEATASCVEAQLPQVSVAAARIVAAADELKLPTISFFCNTRPAINHPSSSTDTKVDIAAPILGLVYSLIFQLIDVLPPLTETGPLIDMSQVESLDGNITSLPKALELFSQLLTLAPPYLVCVIDSFHDFEPSIKNTTHTRDFLGVIKKSLDLEHKIFKFLFTDSMRAFSLLPEIPSERREIVEGVRTTGNGWMGASAGRAFADLRFDD